MLLGFFHMQKYKKNRDNQQLLKKNQKKLKKNTVIKEEHVISKQ